MIKQFTTRSRHYDTEQKSSRKSQKMFEECQKVIKELQSQLQYALQQNQQKDQIIRLLTEQKQFYEQESRKNDQKMYPKLKEQISFNQSLINGLKQHNKQLADKNLLLEHENKDLWQKCKQKDDILKITEENLNKIQQEKSRLEKQWSQTLRCVKKKIFEIQQEKNIYDRLNDERQINSKKSLPKTRDIREPSRSNQQKRKNSINLAQKQKNEDKVKEILKQIDQKLLNYDFIEMVQNKVILQEMSYEDTLESNKQNICGNVNPKSNNINQGKNRKVPILKFGQLRLKEE